MRSSFPIPGMSAFHRLLPSTSSASIRKRAVCFPAARGLPWTTDKGGKRTFGSSNAYVLGECPSDPQQKR